MSNSRPFAPSKIIFNDFLTHPIQGKLQKVKPEGGFSLDLRSADKELKAVTPEK